MTGLAIFSVIELAGCVFLIYFMYALWRDGRSSGKRRLELRPLPGGKKPKGKLLFLRHPGETPMRAIKQMRSR